MTDYSAVVFRQRHGKKFIFFKKYNCYFQAIYLDEKFYKKTKWPGHMGRWAIKFQGKGHYWDVPEKCQLDAVSVSESNTHVHYSPSEAEAIEFDKMFGGKLKILDSAKYDTKNGKFFFTCYNIYDEENKRYVIFIDGCFVDASVKKYEDMIKFVERDLRKWFHDNRKD